MSRRNDVEVVERLTAIETKLDAQQTLFKNCVDGIVASATTNTNTLSTNVNSINANLMKVVYALVGIIAANVGVQFTPHSPINWQLGVDQSTRFLGIFACFFLSFMLWRAYKHKKINNKNPKWLVIGLQAIAISLFCTTFLQLNIAETFWFVLPFRLTYIISFIIYAWKIW